MEFTFFDENPKSVPDKLGVDLAAAHWRQSLEVILVTVGACRWGRRAGGALVPPGMPGHPAVSSDWPGLGPEQDVCPIVAEADN